MFNQRIKFVINRDTMWGDTFGLRMGIVRGDKIAVAQQVQFKQLTEEEAVIEGAHAMVLNRDDLQNLMDELWTVGIRPTEGTGSAGSLAATERHLADMRALVFKQHGALTPSQAPIQ